MQPIPPLQLILDGIRWVLVGGMALRAFMPERATLDVDIMIHVQDEPAARAAFDSAGYRLTGPLTIGGFTAHPPGDEPPIDVLTSAAPWLDQALDHPARDAAGFPVMPRPYLQLLKLQAGRIQDLADVQRMLRDTPAVERVTTHQLIQHYAPDLSDDYASLITLADLEFGPPSS